jgi:hypothetical protein
MIGYNRSFEPFSKKYQRHTICGVQGVTGVLEMIKSHEATSFGKLTDAKPTVA